MTSGDRELFARLMEQTQRPVYAFLAGKLKDRGVVADVAQEAFFRHTDALTPMTAAGHSCRGS